MVGLSKDVFTLREICTAGPCPEKSVTRVIERESNRRHDLCQKHRDAIMSNISTGMLEEVEVFWNAGRRRLQSTHEKR